MSERWATRHTRPPGGASSNPPRSRGWSIAVDQHYGPASEDVCRKFQREKNLGVDGLVGPNTWAAAWTSPVT